MKGTRKFPQVALRMPPDLKAWIQAQAEKESRSMNAEIVRRLKASRDREEVAGNEAGSS